MVLQEKAAAKAKAVDAYNEAHRAKPLMEQHANKSKKVASSSQPFSLLAYMYWTPPNCLYHRVHHSVSLQSSQAEV